MFETIEVLDVKMEIGLFVKSYRKNQNMSQTDLAKLLNVSRTTIQNIELGKNYTIDTLLKVIKEFDLLPKLQGEIKKAKLQLTDVKSLY